MADETLTPRSLGGLTVSKAQERSEFLNMMIYGPSGYGKTVFGGSAQAVKEMAPVLSLDAEGGSESLRNSYPEVDVVRIKSWEQSVNVYSDIYDQISNSTFPYNTIVIDSLNEYQKFSMLSIMEMVVKEHPERDIEVPSKREYLINLEQMRRMVRGFRDLEVHTIFTCLSSSYRDEMTGKVNNEPLLTGKFQKEVPALIDEVWFGYKREFGVGDDREMKRYLLTDSTDTTIAKSRNGKLPIAIEEPTMTEIYKYLKNQGVK